MGKLRQKMIRAMELKNLSANTQRTYLTAVTGITKHYQKSPEKLSKVMIEDYLHCLPKDCCPNCVIIIKHFGLKPICFPPPISIKKHQPLSYESVRNLYEKARKKARVKEGVGIHTMRHSFATLPFSNPCHFEKGSLMIGKLQWLWITAMVSGTKCQKNMIRS